MTRVTLTVLRRAWEDARLQPHDASGVQDPAAHEWYQYRGVWYPIVSARRISWRTAGTSEVLENV